MKLQNIYPHKRNTQLTVNGHTYWIGPGGFIVMQGKPLEPLDVPEEDATKLLQGKAWQKLDWDPMDPANQRRFHMPIPVSPHALGRPPREKSVLDVEQGLKPILKGVADKAPEGVELAKLVKADAEQAAISAKRGSVEDFSSIPEDVVDPEPKSKQEVVETKWEIPEDGDWPDPVEEMPLDYLKEMAKAYDVSCKGNLKKQTLIERITEVMYSENEEE